MFLESPPTATATIPLQNHGVCDNHKWNTLHVCRSTGSRYIVKLLQALQREMIVRRVGKVVYGIQK